MSGIPTRDIFLEIGKRIALLLPFVFLKKRYPKIFKLQVFCTYFALTRVKLLVIEKQKRKKSSNCDGEIFNVLINIFKIFFKLQNQKIEFLGKVRHF